MFKTALKTYTNIVFAIKNIPMKLVFFIIIHEETS